MTVYGYARVSTEDQRLDLQIDALKAADCDEIFTDKFSGRYTKDRKELNKMLKKVKPGDKIIVWKLDRLARSLRDLLKLTDHFRENCIEFESLKEKIDTQTATGKLMFNLLMILSEFEREMTNERIQAGLAAARQRGAKFGRPAAMTLDKQRAVIQLLEADTGLSDIAKIVGVSRSTLWRFLKRNSLTSEEVGNGKTYKRFERSVLET